MDRPALSLLLAVVIASLAPACADAPPRASPRDDASALAATPPAPAPAGRDRPPVPLGPARLVAALPTGALAEVDPGTGAVIAASAPIGARVRDVIVDAEGARLVALAIEDDGDGGAIAAVAFGRAQLGPPERLAWVDGDARLVATPPGVVVVEAGYGDRWRLLARDGAPRASVVAPPPSSIDAPAAAGGSLRALVRADDGLARAVAYVDEAGLAAPTVAPLAADPPCGEDARWVEVPGLGGAFVVDVHRGEIVVRAAVGSRAGPAPSARVAIGPPLAVAAVGPRARLQHAVALGSAPRLAVLLAKPARLVLVDLDGLGAPRAAAIDLPGDLRLEPRFFSRELAVLGDRVFVATTAGVVAVDASPGVAAVDARFEGDALAGPLAVLESPREVAP